MKIFRFVLLESSLKANKLQAVISINWHEHELLVIHPKISKPRAYANSIEFSIFDHTHTQTHKHLVSSKTDSCFCVAIHFYSNRYPTISVHLIV